YLLFLPSKDVIIDRNVTGVQTCAHPISQTYDWEHGTMVGALLASGQTAASAEAKVGTLRHDPMAMLPFIGYNAGEYLQNWIDMEIGRASCRDRVNVLGLW